MAISRQDGSDQDGSDQDGSDPTGVRTVEAFMRLLLQARNESALSIVEIVARARERGYELDAVGLNRALLSPALPAWQIVTGVLVACGMGGMQIDRWMRVYHDLATPAQMAASVTAVLKPIDIEPVSAPPLTPLTPVPISSAPAALEPRRRGRRNFAIAAGAMAALVGLALLLFALLNGGSGIVAAEAISAAPQTTIAEPSDFTVAQPSPSDSAVATTPTPATTTVKPPPRTSAPPSPSPTPSPRPSPSPSGSGVLRSGTVSLTGSNPAFDLDGGQTGGVHDIYRISGTALARANGMGLELMSSMPANKQACQAVRGWETWVGNLHAGQWLCVLTSDGRFGRLNITATGDPLKLAYTVWT